MKKKFSSILLAVFMLFACVFVSACGNKYDDMEFKIYYAFSEDASEWFDGSDGFSLNYMTEADKENLTAKGVSYDETTLLNFSDSKATLYIKIEIENVKAKHIDKITVNASYSSGLNFKNATVSEGEVLAIEITGNVKTTLSFYETNSKKSTKLDFSVYRSLTEISADLSVKPALKIGNAIDLSKINNLTYLPQYQTNQTGVEYSILSIGKYDNAGNYVTFKTDKAVLNGILALNGNILSILNGNEFNVDNYVIKIKATSVYNSEITAEFDVYVENSGDYTPVVKFANGNEINADSGNKIVLANNNTSYYSSTTISVDISGSGSFYLNGGRYTLNNNDIDTTEYTTEIYVDGIYYDLENNSTGINGLIIAENAGNYTITLGSNNSTLTSKFLIRKVLNDLDFSATTSALYKNYYEKEITVEKQLLPTQISINGEMYANNGSGSGTVYSVSNATYKGLALTLSASPTNNSENVYFEIEGASGLQIRDAYNNNVDLTKIKNGSTIYIKFAGNDSTKTITIKTRNNPTWFNGQDVSTGEYVSVSYTLTKSVTASKIELFIDEDCTIPASTSSTSIVETNLIVDSVNGGYVYAKVYHEGNLDTTSIAITSSDGSVKVQSNLSDLSSEEFTGGKIYTIPLTAAEVDKTSTITLVAGNGLVGTSAYAVALTRKTLSSVSSMSVTGNNNVTQVNTGFAIAKGEFAEFLVLNGSDSTGIYDVQTTENGTNNCTIQRTSASTFSVVGNNVSEEGTTLIVNAYYYSDVDQDGNSIGYVTKLCKTIPIKVAIYNAIGVFSASSLTNSALAYVNSQFADAATTSFTFSAYTSNYATPTLGTVLDGNANGFKITFAESIKGLIENGSVDVYFNGAKLGKDGTTVNPINSNTGFEITVTLNNVVNVDYLPIQIKALRFGAETNKAYTTINVPVYKVDKATGITISDDNNKTNIADKIKSISDTTYELQLSFVDVAEGGADYNYFYANLEFADTQPNNTIRFSQVNNANMTYLLYQYEMEEDGSLTTDENDEYVLEQVARDRLSVDFTNGKVTVGALKYLNGGLFKLVIASKDSYYETTDADGNTITGYSNTFAIDVRVSDGSTKTPFILYTDADITNMNSNNSDVNLNKHFVLGANISYSGDPIGTVVGSGVNHFEGSLSGKLSTSNGDNYYTLTVTISSVKQTSDNEDVAGLFASIGENGKVSDLNLIVILNDISVGNTHPLYVGALAAVNKGTIENVKISILDAQTVTLANTADVNFGLVAAVNEGTITNAVVECKSSLKLTLASAVAYNIGLIAGVNQGTITGSYLGKDSLNSVVFDVIANLSIASSVKTGDATISAGVVAGSNAATIQKILVGGKITTTSGNLKGNIGGVVGSSTNEINTVATLGLDIDARLTTSVSIAGVAGTSSGNITDAKFISAKTETSVGTTYGELKGDTVAGIVANASAGTISTASVESFVNTKDDSTFYTLNGATVYGLVGGTATISSSFVNANINATTAYLTADVGTTNTYFVGAVNDSATINEITNSSTYAIVLTLNTNSEVTGIDYSVSGGALATLTLANYINNVTLEDSYASTADFENEYIYNSFDNSRATAYEAGKTYYKKELKTSDWTTFAKSLVSSVSNWNTDANWRLSETYNTIKYGEVSFYFPYLIEKYEIDGTTLTRPIMIEQPTDIKTPLNSSYTVTPEAIIVTPFTLEGKNVTETMVVNYYYATNKTTNNLLTANTHNLITTYKADGSVDKQGLINLEIFPAGAQGGVQFKVVSGFSYATINSDNTITFKGVSGSTPIIVRAYSLFNSAIESYTVFYTQMLASSLELSSNVVTKVSANNYVGSLYTGQAEQLIKLSAENLFKGNYYQSIFDYYGIESYLSLVADANSYLDIDTSSVSNIKIAINPNATFETGTETTVKFTLYLKDSYFTGATAPTSTEICSVTLKLTLYKSATSLVLGGDSAYEVSSNEALSLSATLYTGWLSSIKLTNDNETVTRVGNTFVITATGRDTIIISFADISTGNYFNSYINELDELKIIDKENFNIAELFKDPTIRTTSIYDNLDNCIGYQFDIVLELRDEYYIRYLTNNLEFKVVLTADSDPTVTDSTEVTFKPTNVSTARIENYAVVDISAANGIQNVLKNNNVETALIDPSSKGNLMIVYLEPEYAYVNEITLTTSTAQIPALNNKEVGLHFTQFVYNEKTGRFETLVSTQANVQTGNTLKLTTISNSDGTFSGRFYIYVTIEKFGGKEVDFTATLNIKTGSDEEITVYKYLTTSYLPSVSISYSGTTIKDSNNQTVNLVEKGSYNNVADVTLYGYQFNSNPVLTFEWDLTGVTGYQYVDGSTQKIAKAEDVTSSTDSNGDTIYTLNENATQYLIGDYVSGRMKNDYTEVTFNTTNESYSMQALFSVVSSYNNKTIPAPFKMNVKLSLVDKNSATVSESASITFHPTDYILKDISITNINSNNKNLVIGTTTKLEFGFTTENTILDNSETLYTAMVEAISAVYNDEGTKTGNDYSKLANLFYYIENGGEVKLSTTENAHSGFNVNIVNEKYITLYGKANFSNTIYLKVGYKYVPQGDGTYKLQFANDYSNFVDYSFTLNVISATTDENAFPIYEASDMFDSNGNCILAENSYNILMNDIVLENINPIDVAIASLDGNNRVITIKSFNVNAENSYYGLFANFGSYTDADGNTQQSILKNVIVDYSEFEGDLTLTKEFTSITFGGLVASNSGLIYNCDVINKSSTKEASVGILVEDSSEVTVTFGGLVGSNSGVITNSRVGRSTITAITASATTESVSTYDTGKLTFVLGNDTSSTNKFNITAGAFVGSNSGTISNSYVKNTSIINYSTSETTNKTAGFAGENASAGKILYSYVEGGEGKSSQTAYSTGSVIESKGNGIVAGFVYTNSGTISNSYANTVLQTKSAYISGFVYNNQNDASISESYAACTMNAGNGDSFAEQPFVGVDNTGTLLSYGTLTNCYYLLDGYNVAVTEETKPQATALNVENFSKSENLAGFVFVLSETKAEREQGIWSYYDVDNKQYCLPTLISANTISHSYRYLVETTTSAETGTTNSYANAASYELGTKNNPYIISNVTQFNEAFTVYDARYVRLINYVDFKSDEEAIATRTITLGTSGYSNVTSFEGNGLTVSGIYFDVGNSVVEKLGLFAEIENAYIKNLNLEFATPTTENQFSTTTVNYSGGLAGIISNSVILNVSLNGANTTLTGANFVGGLAGLIKGDSLIYGVSTNLSVKVSSTNTADIYYNLNDYIALGLGTASDYQTYLKKLSFAGGVAGVLDLTERSNASTSNSFNVSYIDVYGNEMIAKTKNNEPEANILASFSGGVAGYASKATNSLKLKYHTGLTDLIRGDNVAGGIYGICLGSVTASQVTADEETQFTYDSSLGTYVMSLGTSSEESVTKVLTGETSSTELNFGNLNLIESYGYAGGLIGVAVGANVNASYAKVGFKSGLTIGGLIGASVASGVEYSYAVPYLNLKNVVNKNTLDEVLASTKIGGLIGSAYKLSATTVTRNDYIKNFENLAKHYATGNEIPNDIKFTFSTVILNNSELTELTVAPENATAAQTEAVENVKKALTIDYICADYGYNSTEVDVIKEPRLFVYSGLVDYNKDALTISANASSASIDMVDLYNLENSAEQVVAFNTVFSGWSNNIYWSLNNEKYFPLLINDPVANYIEIETESDFYYMLSNPNGNYKIVNNITIEEGENHFYNGGNWIFDVNFTGVLIGEIEDNGTVGRPVVTIDCALTPKTADTTAGLFKQTTGATINNVTFVWNYAINFSGVSSLKTVAGLSCTDEGSLFSTVDVHAVKVSGDTDGNYLIGTEDSTEETAITGFGGLVGSATNTNILACTFSGSVNATLKNEGGDVHFGGLVAEIKAEDDSATPNKVESGSVMTSYVGVSKGELVTENNQNGGTYTPAATSFKLTLANYSNAYIGAAMGETNNIAISAVNVGGTSYTDYKRVAMEVTNCSSSQTDGTRIGGLVGSATNTATVSSDINVDLSVNANNANILTGGLFGYYTVSATSTEEGEDGETAKVKGIRTTNALANITFTGNANQLYVSAGVGKAEGPVTIQQCLLTGEITNKDSEAEPTIDSASTAYYGGAVACSAGSLTLQEVMSTANITTADATTLYAGGLVGGVEDSTISYSATTGKLVPIGTTCYVGGLIGSVAGATTVGYSYTLTSIVADSVANENIATATINALFGKISGSVKAGADVFYSSDISLAPDSNKDNYGTNLGANIIWFSQLWHKGLLEGDALQGVWGELISGDVNKIRIPYITSLASALSNYGIIAKDSEHGLTDYILGSALRPFRITNTLDLSTASGYYAGISGGSAQYKADAYSYFLLEGNSEGKAELTGTLNGILVGSDSATFTNPTLSGKTSGAVTYNGLISNVKAGSAVSNIHLQLESTDEITANGITGLVVGLNTGVVFNCSVQGSSLTISGSGFAGLVAGENQGLVSYCYSTAEILSTGASLGGIVYQNSSKLMSNYFTGYINNETTDAAGILVQSADGAYVYNNYMAGVIENISGNSFSASATITGSKNYIDKLANIETSVTGTIELKSTYEIMEKSILFGKWHSVVDSANKVININSNGFGNNYNYPVYNFNKQTTTDGTTYTLVDFNNQTYTGKGTGDGDEFKVPHLGVLSSIQGLLDDSTNRTYVLIYDIDGKIAENEYQIWTAVGTLCTDTDKDGTDCDTDEDPIHGFAQSKQGFHGTFKSAKNFALTTDLCTITNLNNNGLFANINNAYIGDIILGSFRSLVGSGALGTTVTGDVTVSNITFVANSVVEGKSDAETFYGALFGDINSTGTATISKFVTYGAVPESSDQIYVTLSGSDSTTAGLIAGKLSAGTLQLSGSDNVLYALFGENAIAGGLVGEMVDGEINGGKNTINLRSVDAITNYGGIVGKTSENLSCLIANVIVNLEGTLGSGGVSNKINAQVFGGVVALCNGEIANGSTNITITTNSDGGTYVFGDSATAFGLVAGIQTAAINLTCFNVEELTTIEVIGEKYEENTPGFGVGALVGSQSANLAVTFSSNLGSLNEDKGLLIKVTGVPNLGGVAGYYGGGTVNITNFGEVQLMGTTNVGGIYGYAVGAIDTANIEISGGYAMTATSSFATIYVNGTSTAGDAKNFGGLFGWLTNEISNSVGETITNPNPISYSTSAETTLYAQNIGGIAGKFTGTTASGLTNNASILTANASENNISNLVDSQVTVRTTNVGGIFGYVDDSGLSDTSTTADEEPEESKKPTPVTISSCINQASVSGYQNVGGLVGVMSGNVTLTGSITLTEGETGLKFTSTEAAAQTTNAKDCYVSLEKISIYGVISVGGAVGYADENSTINLVYIYLFNVYGNANVGGLVGTASQATLANNHLVSAQVKGIYYQYATGTGSDAKIAQFIPTNVGGLAGSLQNSIVNNNLLQSVKITSTEEGGSNPTISTIENYMANVESLSADTTLSLDEESIIKFAEVQTGFGGFAGSIDAATMSGKVDEIKSNHINLLEINAQLGINVGTYYGAYCDAEGIAIGGSNKVQVTPEITGDAKVDGAYNIGGIIGYIQGTNISTSSNADLTGSAKIVLQSNNVGMYVGGLYGKVESNNVSGLQISTGNDVDIIICTSKSYYMGGLVGQLAISTGNTFTGSVGNWSTDGTRLVDDKVTDSDIDSIEVSTNFGGLVGMVKSTATGGIEIKVQGTHNYAFTVNTILNSGYADGGTQTGAELSYDETEVTLLAQAYYINKDSFTISATNHDSWYDADANNPLNNTQTKGWAKEYTGFKAVSRLIPTGGGTWDALINVYDASYITAVGTVLNTGASGSYSYEAKTDDADHPVETKTDGDFSTDPNKIIYTVYQTEVGEAYMYTPIGIAKLAVFSDYAANTKVLITSKNKVNNDDEGNTLIARYESLKAVQDKEYAGDLESEYSKPIKWDVDGDDTTDENVPGGKSVATLSSYSDLMYFNWKGAVDTDSNHRFKYYIDDEHTEEFYGLTKAYYYVMPTYYYDTDGDGTPEKVNNVYFDFQIIYANKTMSEISSTISSSYGNNPQVPSSGSVFEISGYAPKFGTSVVEETKSAWGWIVFAVVTVLCVLAAIVTWGAAAGATMPFWLWAAGYFIYHNAVLMIIIGSVAIAASLALAIITTVIATATTSETYLSSIYFSTKEQNMGLMSNAHTSEVYYIDGIYDSQNDIGSIVAENGAIYFYYSVNRPADYYSNYWFVTPTLTCEDPDTNGVYKYAGEYPYSEINESELTGKGYEVIEKYIYKNGAYYYYPLASRTDYYQTHVLSNANLPAGISYITKNGKTYIAGEYEPTSAEPYTMKEYSEALNNLTYSDGKYYLNGYEYTGSVSETEPQTYAYYGMVPSGMAEGYDYFKYVYLTLDGYADESGLSAFATYTYLGDVETTSEPETKEGYDYIIRDYQKSNKDSSGNYLYVSGNFYKISDYKISATEIEVGGTKYKIADYDRYSTNELYTGTSAYFTLSNFTASNQDESALTTPTSSPGDISYAVYPGAFIKPYKSEVGADAKRSAVYVNIKSGLFTPIPEVTIEEDIPYFFYNGGYITDKTFADSTTNTSDDVSCATKVYTLVCDSNLEYKGQDISSQQIKLYLSDGSSVNASIAGIYNGNYNDYYTIDVSKYQDYLAKLDQYKVKNVYKKYSNSMYKVNELYFIGGEASAYSGTEGGCVYKLYTYNAAKTELSFIYNKYLTNEKWQLYTLNKFTDNLNGVKFTDSDGNIYYLIPNTSTTDFTGNPNIPITYFAENCKVTLGGNLYLTHTGSSDATSGTITVG